ncbi:TSUP family transporter [Vibrio natriegens]|uniref:TSUP family transporter n=1 Tax=Vibrio natriegens TaxID=691 RepID=UPI003F838A8C
MSEFIIISTLIVAGFIRGYTGFGFSALVILVLSSMYPVAEMVPAVLLLDLLVCLPLVASAWNKTDFKTLTPLLWATGLGVPFGYLLLLYLPDNQLKVIVPGAILALAALSHSKHALTLQLSRSPLLCGFMSGWTTSAVSAGGAPVVIYMRYSKMPIDVQRNSLISYFFLTTCFVVGSSYVMTKQWYFMPEHPLGYALIAMTALMAGKLAFKYKNLNIIHQAAFYLMLILSALALLRAIWML